MCGVTTHTGGVDWNGCIIIVYFNTVSHHPHGWCGLKLACSSLSFWSFTVTTHTGGVDWNGHILQIIRIDVVTTHTGGVDWNTVFKCWSWWPKKSPPTRVVWIEIATRQKCQHNQWGHHPHGWCGLKFRHHLLVVLLAWSPPTRVVWIEMLGATLAEIRDESPPTRVVWIEMQN